MKFLIIEAYLLSVETSSTCDTNKTQTYFFAWFQNRIWNLFSLIIDKSKNVAGLNDSSLNTEIALAATSSANDMLTRRS